MRAICRRFAGVAPTLIACAVLILFPVAVATPARAGGSELRGGHPCPPAGNPDCGDPITVSTGNVFDEQNDYRSAGPDKLILNRYYNTPFQIFNYFTSFGNWRSNYDSFVYIPFNSDGTIGSVDVILPDNKNFWFYPDGSGGWTGPHDINGRLQITGSITATFTDWNDTVWTYTINYPGTYNGLANDYVVLTSIRSRNGYTQTLEYVGNNDQNYNPLISVTDSYGRQLSYTYNSILPCGPLAHCARSVTTPDGLVLNYSYDGAGNLTKVTYSSDPPTSQTYLYEGPAFADGRLRLSGIVDEDGNPYASWTYDDNPASPTFGFALSTGHAGGADLTTVVYNNDGSRLVTNPLGQQELYKFNSFDTGTSGSIAISGEIDRLATATTAAAKRLFTYDSNGNYASKTDWNGNTTTFVNDARGRPTTITEATGTPQQRVTQITWHGSFNLPTQIVAPGLTTNFTYDANGKLLTRTETDTTTTTVPYSTNGQTRIWNYTWAGSRLASVTDPRGNTTHFDWDSSGGLDAITNALGQVTHIPVHTGGGLPLTVVDPNGVVTNLAYDARQRLVSRTVNTSAGSLTTTYSYDAAGNLTQVTQPDGSAFGNTYDAAHRLVAVADLFGQQIRYALDALGNRTQTHVLNSASTIVGQHSATFDALGRILQEIGGAGQTTSYAYDANGNRATITDPLGRVTHQVFDPLNRRTQTTDAANGVTGVAYDAHDRPVSVTDPNGNTTTYIYDGFGDLIGQISPDSGWTVFWYDSNGNLVTREDNASTTTYYYYDALDRLTAKIYANGTAENVTYIYDEAGHGFGVGRLTTITDNGGQTGALKLSYDERGNAVSAVRNAGSVKLMTAYAYDAASRVAAVTYPSGWTAGYTRDPMGRITAIDAQPPGPKAPRAGRLAGFGKSMPNFGLPMAGPPLSSASVASAIGYLPFGPVSGLSYGNGIVETRAFDLDYRATALADSGAKTMQNLSYSYDAANNVMAIADGVTPGNSQSFTYDVLNRLTNATGGYGQIAYAYDPVGNLLTRTVNDGYQSATVNFSYTAGSNRLTGLSQGSTAIRQFGYTATGNIASDLQLVAGAWVGNDLHYNQVGRLATAVSVAGFGKTSQSTNYAYDAFGQRLLKQGPGGLRYYQYDQAGHLLEEGSLANGSATPERDYIYLGNRPVAVLLPATGALFFLQGDRLDTPQFATDTGERVQWKANYQPFGSIRPMILNLAQNLRLPGQYADPETGYYHSGFRDYDPSLGRYLQSDPIGLLGGLNTYAYALGNPLKRFDRYGLKPETGKPEEESPKEKVAKEILKQIVKGVINSSNMPQLIEFAEGVEFFLWPLELGENLLDAIKEFNYDPRKDADYWYKQIDKQLGIGDPCEPSQQQEGNWSNPNPMNAYPPGSAYPNGYNQGTGGAFNP
jgi:RHS repeat-associated protein